MKLINHLKTINKHKYYVTMLCFKCGLYKQGLLHDLSKYSPTELKTGAKYWVGTRSPNSIERETIGYSTAWLHHKGRNKHHWEYWIDFSAVKPQMIVDGGVGIGRITKKGLARPVGAAAINPVPLKMIEAALKETAEAFGYEGGLQAVISAPQGVEIAKKTFNPQLGITGGISILGTSGIVEPMSEQALIDTIRTEMKMHLADGEQTLLITPGNYGQDFLHETLKIELKRSIKCSNFIGDTIDMGCELGAKGMLFVGHIGKLVKLGAGIMNTHSKMADGRMEILAACAVQAGAGIETVRNILDCVTTDAALELLKNEKILGKTMEQLMLRIDACLQKRGGDNMQIGAVVFSNEYGLLGKTEQADELLLKITVDVSSEK